MAVLIWSAVGFYMVLFTAAIEAIPEELLEAALLDGAGGWATFRKVTLPLVRDTSRSPASTSASWRWTASRWCRS